MTPVDSFPGGQLPETQKLARTTKGKYFQDDQRSETKNLSQTTPVDSFLGGQLPETQELARTTKGENFQDSRMPET